MPPPKVVRRTNSVNSDALVRDFFPPFITGRAKQATWRIPHWSPTQVFAPPLERRNIMFLDWFALFAFSGIVAIGRFHPMSVDEPTIDDSL
ncbi:MAG TPA: hypothetical protein VKD69_11405 [Vicinamibacterales bacterium]|nr:hypothetical protein [Vicinamibacterales bacterium]